MCEGEAPSNWRREIRSWWQSEGILHSILFYQSYPYSGSSQLSGFRDFSGSWKLFKACLKMDRGCCQTALELHRSWCERGAGKCRLNCTWHQQQRHTYWLSDLYLVSYLLIESSCVPNWLNRIIRNVYISTIHISCVEWGITATGLILLTHSIDH